MIQPLAGDDRDLIGVPISEFQITAKGRQALADGKFELELERPGFDSELALDLLFAVAGWEDTCAQRAGARDEPPGMGGVGKPRPMPGPPQPKAAT